MKYRGTRYWTCRLHDMVDQGLLDRDNVINAFTSYLSEDDVYKMMRANEFIMPEDEEEEEDQEEDLLDNFNYVGSRHHY